MNAERTRRIFGLSLVAWLAMVGVMAVMAGVKWDQPGFRDQDITSPLEMAMTIGMVMAIPLAGVAFGLLAPMTLAADRLILGRLPRGINMAIGGCLALPALPIFLALFWLTLGGNKTLAQFVQTLRNMPDTLIGFLITFAIGGLIVSLGMRRRKGV